MKLKLNKNQIKRFSRQIVLKNIGIIGQKKITSSKVLVVGMGGLGCPVAEFLTRAGIGTLGIIDNDTVDLTNIHRQSLYDSNDLKKAKVKVAQKKLNKINSKTKAIAVVHYLGVPVDMPKVVNIAKKHNLFLLEDCALAQNRTLESGRNGAVLLEI